MKVYRNIKKLSKKKRKKYAAKLVPIVENLCFELGVTEDNLIYNLETDYEGISLLEAANKDFAAILQRRRDLTRQEDMEALRQYMLSDKPNSAVIKEYMQRKHGVVEKEDHEDKAKPVELNIFLSE